MFGQCYSNGEGVGVSGESANKVIKNTAVNSLSCQAVFEKVPSVTSKVNVLVGGSSRGGIEKVEGHVTSDLSGVPATSVLLFKNSSVTETWLLRPP